MSQLSQYSLYHFCLYLVLSILNRTCNSLCFWVPLLVDEWKYIVQKAQERRTGWYSCNRFNLHRYTLKQTKAQRMDCISLLLWGRNKLLISNCRLFWFCGHRLHRVLFMIKLFSYFINKWGICMVPKSRHGLLPIHKFFCGLEMNDRLLINPIND